MIAGVVTDCCASVEDSEQCEQCDALKYWSRPQR
jgi:hypothetical protein